MSKKIYQKPQAECVVFYSNEEITSVLPVSDYVDPEIGLGPSESVEIGTGEAGWED